MSKKKTLPKTLKQKAVSLFKNEKEEYAYYLKEYKEKYLPSEFYQLELLDELCNDEIDHYISITSRGDGKSFLEIEQYQKQQKSNDNEVDIDFPFL